MLLIGPNAVSAGDGSDALLDSYARGGGRVVVLEQDKPLKGGALPAGLKPAPGGGSFGFVEDPTHAAVTGLTDADFRGWGPHGRLYEKPYVKAERGTRSLVEVGPRLAQTALAEVRVDRASSSYASCRWRTIWPPADPAEIYWRIWCASRALTIGSNCRQGRQCRM